MVSLQTPVKMIFQERNKYALDNTRDFISFMGFRFCDFGSRQFNSSFARRGARHIRPAND